METTAREALARAEFWAAQAMGHYEQGSDQHTTLKGAYDLIRLAAGREEESAQRRAYMAAQIR